MKSLDKLADECHAVDAQLVGLPEEDWPDIERR